MVLAAWCLQPDGWWSRQPEDYAHLGAHAAPDWQTPRQGKDMWSSSHFVTGVIGLVLLGLQGMLSAFFEVRRGGGRWVWPTHRAQAPHIASGSAPPGPALPSAPTRVYSAPWPEHPAHVGSLPLTTSALPPCSSLPRRRTTPTPAACTPTLAPQSWRCSWCTPAWACSWACPSEPPPLAGCCYCSAGTLGASRMPPCRRFSVPVWPDLLAALLAWTCFRWGARECTESP